MGTNYYVVENVCECCSTHRDAMHEYAMIVGSEDHYRNEQWILTDWDVWVKNPHYRGPAQPHPESWDIDELMIGEE